MRVSRCLKFAVSALAASYSAVYGDPLLDPDLDPALMQTQKLDAPVVAESANADSAFDEGDVIEVVDGDDLDQSFIDELENSMSEEIRQDQLGS